MAPPYNPEVNVSQSSIPPFIAPTAPSKIKARFWPWTSCEKGLEDIRPAMDYFQEFLTENEWASGEFVGRVERVWVMYRQQVQQSTGQKEGILSIFTDRDSHKKTEQLRELVDSLIKDLRDRGTGQAIERAKRRAQKFRSTLNIISEDSPVAAEAAYATSPEQKRPSRQYSPSF